MKNFLIVLYRYITSFGFNPVYFFKWITNFFWYAWDYFKIIKQAKWKKDFSIKPTFPCLHDKYDNWWTAKWHYFHQDLLIARKIYKNNPEKHVDI